MWQRLLGLDFRRRRLLRRAPPGPMRDYLSVPFPPRGRDWREVEFAALDLETTGLDVVRDGILSIGLVSLRGGRIDLSTAYSLLVLPDGGIPEASAVIHRITDDRAAQGLPLAEAMAFMLPRLAGRVLVAHNARFDHAFLDAACRRLFAVPLLLPLIDTQALALHSLRRRNQVYRDSDLRLHALRERYGLPRYRAHDALTDALAVAELFLAQIAHVGLEGGAPLKRLLT
jgi:DNA polymerase III subunit epsilon